MIGKKLFLLLFVFMSLFVTLPASVFAQSVSRNGTVPEEILRSKQNQRYQWFAGQRLYGQEEISARVLSETWHKEIAKAGMLHSANQFSETADWISRGPTSVTNIFGENNYSGRVRGLAVHPLNPDIVYAGAASGGIWKTTDGGGSWNDLSFELASCTFGAIAIDPANPDIVYAGTGEVVAWPQNYIFDGRGLFKSIDDGSAWTRITEGFGLITQFADLEVSPHDSNLLLAGLAGGYSNSQDSLDNKGIWRSTDSGLTWNQVLSLESGYNGAYEVAFDPVNPSMAYAGIGDYGISYSNSGFYMSADSGRTWDKLGTGLPESINRIQFSQSVSTPSQFYALLYHYQYTPFQTRLYQSVDAGTTWVQSAAEHSFGSGSRDQGFYDLCLSVDPANSDHVLAGNILLWQTTDGNTFGDFIQNVHFDNHIIRFSPSNPAVIYLGCDGGVYRSEDGGLNWEDRNQGLSTLQLYAMSSHPTDKNQMAAGSQDNWNFMTRDCGLTPWWQISLGGDGYGICYDFEHPDTLYCMTGTSLWKTLDSGDHFTKILSNLGYLTRIRQPTFCMNAQNSQQLTIPSTKVWRSNDGGENWESITGDIFPQGVTSLCQSPVNSDIFVVTTYETQIMVSTDGGYIWSDVSCQLPGPSRYISRLVSHPADQNTFFAVHSGYGSGKIFRTVDLGNTWSDVSGNLPDVPYSDLFIDPENRDVYLAANDLGVYGTSDAGQTWERIGKNMPFVVALDFDYFCHQGERLLRVATYGRGVYEIDLNSLVIQSDVQDVNDRPSIIQSIEDFTLQEDFGSQLIAPNLYTYFSDAPPETLLTFSASSLDSLTQPVLQNDSLIITSVLNAWGDDAIVITATDIPGLSVKDTFKVHIQPLNDPPEFTDLPDTLSFANNETDTLFFWDCIEDPETPDSLLIYEFVPVRDSLIVHYDSKSGCLMLSAQNGYFGQTDLFVSVTDDSGAVASDSLIVKAHQPTEVAQSDEQIPVAFKLYQNYPNPFNPETIIRYDVAKYGHIKLDIYNILGRRIRTLVNEIKDSGSHEIIWNARDDNDNSVTSGVYFIKLEGEKIIDVKKVLLLR